MLADEHMKRVVIVDTSNEIGGDGDIPHSGIGRARRMQVPNVNMQHNVRFEINPSAFFFVIYSVWMVAAICHRIVSPLLFNYCSGHD